MESKNLTKVSMNLSDKTLSNVDLLSEIIGESNRTRVIASALEIAKTILTQVKTGKQIVLRSDDGTEQTVNFIIG